VAVFARPKHDAPLDPAIAQLVVARLIQLHLLDSPAEAVDPAKTAEAIKGFQAGVGLRQTGVLDRKTLAMLAL
jgi:peptidoglycan hydrolase-like protein with peptidoglycan-binding domain